MAAFRILPFQLLRGPAKLSRRLSTSSPPQRALSVPERIEEKRQAALLGGGQARIDAQHRRVSLFPSGRSWRGSPFARPGAAGGLLAGLLHVVHRKKFACHRRHIPRLLGGLFPLGGGHSWRGRGTELEDSRAARAPHIPVGLNGGLKTPAPYAFSMLPRCVGFALICLLQSTNEAATGGGAKFTCFDNSKLGLLECNAWKS